MSSEWYYMSAGKPTGPLSLYKLKQILSAGSLPPTTPVWNETMPAWLPANNVPEFAPPPPRPAPVKLVEPVAIASQTRTESNDRNPPAFQKKTEAAVHFDVQAEFDDDELHEPVRQSPPQIAKSASAEKSFVARPRRPAGEQTAAKHLKAIREATCYTALRSVIAICFWMAMIFVILAIVVSVASLLAGTERGGNAVFMLVVTLSGAVLAGVLLVAWREASELLIDVADTLLHYHANKSHKDQNED